MKHVLITGSNTGIGFAAAIHLARANYHVSAGVRSPTKAEQLPPNLDGNPYATPLRRMLKFFEAQLSQPTQPEAVTAVVQEAIEAIRQSSATSSAKMLSFC